MTGEVGDPGARPPDPRMIPRWQPRSAFRTARAPAGAAGAAGESGADTADDLLIRPFLLTGGRTSPDQVGLRIESLIQTRQGVSQGSLRFEARQIFELCRRPNSVAELAVALRVPVGVARVLVSDLIADGVVTLLQSEELSVQMLERIRDRVRAL